MLFEYLNIYSDISNKVSTIHIYTIFLNGVDTNVHIHRTNTNSNMNQIFCICLHF